ncbi:MAG TPA: septum formation initiator family protein [Bryobacteraceae bacterium]|jgi:cell division protein FtsB|nr:septum formation initiator family protein [Bryobacteraceae bacterium]
MKGPLIKSAYFAAFLVAATYAFFTLRGPHGVPWLLEKQHEIQQIEDQNGKMDKEIERMRDHIKRLESNASEQELEIRERLKLVKPGEKVYITGKPKE